MSSVAVLGIYVAIGSGIWTFFDARKNVRNGATYRDLGSSPGFLAFAVVLVWIVGLPMYLFKRNRWKKSHLVLGPNTLETSSNGNRPGSIRVSPAIALLVIIFFFVFLYTYVKVEMANPSLPSSPPLQSAQSAQSAQVASLGEPALDGQFTFTVSHALCGVKNVGVSFGTPGATAQGQYCTFHVVVANHSNSSQIYDLSAQFAFDSAGRKFSADTTADIYGNASGGNTGMDLTTINPGNSISGTIYFDMPVGDRPNRLVLHDSALSGGVTVKVG